MDITSTHPNTTQLIHADSHHQLPKPVISLDFSCNYCHRSYHSAQALGGHQNAHRRERNATLPNPYSEADRQARRPFSYSSNLHHRYRYLPYSGTMTSVAPLHGSLINKPVIGGIQMHSMIQKSSYYSLSSYSSSSLSSSSHRGWSPRSRSLLMDQKHVGFAAAAPCVTNKLGNSCSSTVGLSAPNKGRNDIGVCWLAKEGVGHGMKTNNQEELHKLDLSLKL